MLVAIQLDPGGGGGGGGGNNHGDDTSGDLKR